MTFEEFQEQFHIQLTPQQLAAVERVEGPTLLLAVPGSGKTTVLVTRLGYMIYCRQIPPEQILTLTYTVAATRDMANRFCTTFGEELRDRLEFRTINGICMRILLYFGRRTGKQMYELLGREEERRAILGTIYRQVKGDYATEGELQEIGARITYIKNMMLTEEEIEGLDRESELPIREIYQAYCRTLRGQKRIDYDDQMIYTYRILKSFPEILTDVQRRYRYICVDEAQDTSRIQHAIIALLARGKENLFMVGDEDQSIYGFRAAYPQALLDFERDHPGAQVLLMEDNFRSNASIVESADAFIQKNSLRHEKHMRPTRPVGPEVRKITLKNRRAQYSYLVKVAQDPGRQTAVLYRDNESAIPLIDLLERQGIPYNVKNSDLSFFSHRTVADVCNMIRFALKPTDTELFGKIYYKMTLYMTRQMAEQAMLLSQQEQIPVLDAALRCGGLPEHVRTNCRTIRTHLKKLTEESASEALFRINGPMGYGDYLSRSSMGDGKLFILRSIAQKEESALSLLDRLSLLQATIRDKAYDPDACLILSTIHGSKGLEYDSVFLLDVIDGIFPEEVPSNPAKASRKEVETWEEERRLFYVGVTRAKERLQLFSLELEPSSFVREFAAKPQFSTAAAKESAGRQSPEHVGRNTAYRMPDPDTMPAWGRRAERNESRRPEKKKRLRPNPDWDSGPSADILEEGFREFCDQLGEGLMVEHKLFGQGAVVSMNSSTITIQFADGEKKLGLKVLYMKHLLKPM